ncbi:SDR family NAD(P)-dependent oxidoreductase [Rhodococcus sp. C3V]|uniref:SDR family NAD(P)-dependent oxidoreductase n=1 Tax=Rhodococcus sp. C3V TaxID=3034165 RepID=UPI0023E233C9|nr:SDR family NAD(P)-dependent oxidoreductase [Rhodococcus sp. C3V]MDF3319981.1 SDR family NAD(P)-dependent oxidoreductase [Rhodococcus sp. C3V]
MDVSQMKRRGAVVTGAGSGMGRSIALSLAANGMNVVIADIDKDAAERVCGEAGALGVESLAVPTDVSDLEQVESLAEVAYSTFGDIAVLVNNAGVNWRPFRATWDASIEDAQWMMNVNFWGVLHGHHAFVPRMRKTTDPKHIVNTSSIATLQPSPGHAPYAAAKAAIDGFSLAARSEFEIAGLPIGLSLLYPGVVRTRIATSERLRPIEQQAAQRNLVPWDSYTGRPADTGAENREFIAEQRLVTHAHQAIDPDWVGPMVVNAITESRPYILTHPFSDPIKERAEELLNSYVPAAASLTSQ